MATMDIHKATLTRLSTTLRTLHARRIPFRISHGSTNSTRPRTHPATQTVDISPLRNVLSIDPISRTCLVEPNVPMDVLVSQTLKHRLIPPVVMEFPGITAGGGFAGTAGESSSFRHGFFDDIVEEAEIMLADGAVVTAENPDFPSAKAGPGVRGDRPKSDKKYHDLFRGAAGSLGTLGITTLLKIKLIPTQPWVKVTYTRSSTIPSAIAAVRQAANPDIPAASSLIPSTPSPSTTTTTTVAEAASQEASQNPAREGGPDFVDGIIFSPTHATTITGHLCSHLPPSVTPRTFSGRWDPWYYLHVQSLTSSLPPSSPSSSVVEYLPLPEYLFRYDRAGFWVGRSAFTYFKSLVPFTHLTRGLLDDFLHTRMLYRALHGSGESKRFVVQDLALPYSTAEQFIDYTISEFNIFPLWLCPLKQRASPTFHPHTGVMEPDPTATETGGKGGPVHTPPPKRPQQMLNIGLWGPGPTSPSEFIAKNRSLEHTLSALGGQKWFYAHTYYTETQFWSQYPRAWYEALRSKYGAETLPSVYEKVRVKTGGKEGGTEGGGWKDRARSLWPVAGFVGIWKAIRSGDYHLHRKAEWKYKGSVEEHEGGGERES